jgi:hypothetical protein
VGGRELRRPPRRVYAPPVLAALAALLTLAAPAPDLAVVGALAAAPAGGARAARATKPLLGAPYLPSPLGEGAGRDPDPRFRLDAFDCMTLVETAVALGSASSLAEARVALDDVRYSGPPDYASRNHEVLSQWIPANVAKGWIEDATSALAGVPRRTAAKEYSAASWAAARAAGRTIPGLPRARLPLGHFEVPVVAPADAAAVAPQLTEGTLVFVLRADAPERATRVTHAGLVVRGPGGAALVRHATSTKGVERVIEEPLERFVRRQERAYPRWPVEGLSFWAVRDATARVRALLARPAPAKGTSEAPPAPHPAGL